MPNLFPSKDLKDFTKEDLASLVEALGEKPYRARQLYSWLFAKAASSIDAMTDIPERFRGLLKEKGFSIGTIDVVERAVSADSTVKILLKLKDGEKVESVLIPDGAAGKRLTLCVSTQAGCSLGCRFCMTGTRGAGRNLTLSELMGQVQVAKDEVGKGIVKGYSQVTNVVLMGMGEPLLNYAEVVKFLNILIDPQLALFSPRKVTLSTAGVVPAIKRLGKETNAQLAVSLNATTDEVRTRLMPINKKYPLKELMAALREYPLNRRRRITFEYVLIKGVNDTPQDARRLVELLKGIPSKINLIPFNPFPGSTFERPDKKTVGEFFKTLHDAGYTVVVRAGKGVDIQAACGQLKGK